MRTTLDLDDSLVSKARQRAAEARCTLSELVDQALRVFLVTRAYPGGTAPAYRALTFGDPLRPVSMEPADLARLEALDDRPR